MPKHYSIINKSRTNSTTKALHLFIFEDLFIKIIETILHPSTANHLPRVSVLKFTMRIKKKGTTIKIFRQFTHRQQIASKFRNM